jgi:NADPH oxidase
VSKQQWHPFTITSCPFDRYISVHIRQVGDFTRSLASALGAGKAQSDLYDELDPNGIYEVALAQGEEMPAIRIDGPYGAPAEDVLDNEVAVLVGTGIGVTPWAAILKNIWHMRMLPNPPTRLRRVEFIWVCKDTTSFEWFQALLSSLEAQSAEEAMKGAREGQSSIEFLKIHTYLTQRLNVDEAQNIILNSVGMDKDPLTQLTTNTNFGRPDFGKVLKGMKEGILNQSYGNGLGGGRRTDVGVYFCGPNAAARDIDRACSEATGDGVRFRFWKEHF